MKIIYEIKAILKHRVSYVCLGVLLLLNLLSMIDLERVSLEHTDADLIHNYEYSIYQQQVYFENTKLIDSGKDFTSVQREYLNNFESYTEWKIQNLQEKVNIIRETESSVNRDRQLLFIDLKNTLMLMNANANLDQNDLFAEDVFKRELQRYEQELNLNAVPFKSNWLHKHPYMDNMFSTDLKHNMYMSNYRYAEYFFELLDNGLTDIDFSSVSPWSFLSKQLSHGSLMPLIILPMCLIFSFVYIMDSKANQSLHLLLTRPIKRSHVAGFQISALLIAFLLIVALSFALPMLILGIRHGWRNFNSPVLIDPNGFSGFQTYQHVNEPWLNFGLSYLPSAQAIQENGLNFYISTQLEFCEFSIVLMDAIVLFVFKMLAAISFGSLSAYMFNKSWKATSLLMGLIVFCMISQTTVNGILPMFNIFSVDACLTITQGSGNVTWLNAMILSLVCFFGIYLLICVNLNRKDV